MEQIEDCTVCVGVVLGIKAIVVFFEVLDFLVVALGTIGFACGFECIRAIEVAMADPGIVPYVFSSMVVFKLSGTGLSSDEDKLSGKDGYKFGVFSAIYDIKWYVTYKSNLEGILLLD